jgi:hypothetical protein
MTAVSDCLLVLVVDGLPVDVLEALIETVAEGEAVFVLDFCGEYVDVGLELVVLDTEIEADVVFDDVVVFVDEIELVPVRVVTLDFVIKGLELLDLELLELFLLFGLELFLLFGLELDDDTLVSLFFINSSNSESVSVGSILIILLGFAIILK